MFYKEETAISRGVMCLLGDECGSVLEGDGGLVYYVVRKIIKDRRLAV